MGTEIERLLFYDRQYLQSFDFTAEQAYHLEMRRRLNLALHLWGIAYGLELRRGEIVPGAPEQYYISEGMAIDAYDEPGLYFGTSTGQVFASADEGETWSEIASYLPSISSVDAVVLD
jgi:hypothetical protein